MIDKSELRDFDEENVEVANGANGHQPDNRKPAIMLFLNPDLSVQWVTDQVQIKSIDAALHLLNAMKAALECDRDTMRAMGMHQTMAQKAIEEQQLHAFASYKLRRH